MREYIFTDTERKLLVEYLQKRTKGEGFYSLENRIRNNFSALERDWQLLLKYTKTRDKAQTETQ